MRRFETLTGRAEISAARSEMAQWYSGTSRDILESYVREVNRLLRPGALFKFEVQGYLEMRRDPGETWLGAPFSTRRAVEMAVRCGFDPRFRHGEGQERFWWWFFKWPEAKPD